MVTALLRLHAIFTLNCVLCHSDVLAFLRPRLPNTARCALAQVFSLDPTGLLLRRCFH